MGSKKNTFDSLVDELSAEFRMAVLEATPDNVREHVDAAVIADWVGFEAQTREFHQILSDVARTRVGSDTAKTVLCALAVGYSEKVMTLLQAALVDQVARDLAYAVNTEVENYEPSDGDLEIYRAYFSTPDDERSQLRARVYGVRS